MPYCSIEEAWRETLIDKKPDSVQKIPLITRSKANMNNVTESNKEDSLSVPIIEYSEYSKPKYDIKIQNILKENKMLKEQIKNLNLQSKTIKHKYLINLFLYIFTGVIILLLLDNIPKYNIHSTRRSY